MPSNLIDRIQNFNQGREPERLRLKYQAMRSNPFVFLRATCHLFYEDWSAPDLDRSPLAWICGDLHLENFGVYRSGNRLPYFDINDFDEAALAPCTWDLARLLTSVLVAAPTLGIPSPDAVHLCQGFLDGYTAALKQGSARWIERRKALGIIGNLIDQLEQRDRITFLKERTTLDSSKTKRRLRIDQKRTLPLLPGQRESISAFLPQFAAEYLVIQEAQPKLFRLLEGVQTVNPAFFTLIDAARRVAGTGSLGVDRDVLLVEGKGSPNRNVLLDLKQALPSSLQPYLTHPQPDWQTEAARIVAIQTRVQAFPPALLSATAIGQTPYLIKELQPSTGPADRVKLNQLDRSLARLERFLATIGQVVAWGQLRSSGRQGAASADELIHFAHAQDWQPQLLDYAQHYSQKVQADWQEFQGAIELQNS